MSTLPSGYLRDDHRDIMKKLSRISDALHRLAQDGTLTDESLLRLARTLDHEIERHFMKEEHVLEAALENVKPEERGEIKEILEDMGLHLGIKLEEDDLKQITHARKKKEVEADVEV